MGTREVPKPAVPDKKWFSANVTRLARAAGGFAKYLTALHCVNENELREVVHEALAIKPG